MKGIRFGDAILVSTKDAAAILAEDVRLISIDPISSIHGYSEFILKKLAGYVSTDYVMIVQWDGYVLHPELWDSDFLNYDYIGAGWVKYKDDMLVGNGGFSLRSKRLLLACLSDQVKLSGAEDFVICRDSRRFLENEFDIRFAPISVADRFSVEHRSIDCKNSFGFHGFFRFPDVFDEVFLLDFVQRLPPPMLQGADARKFCKKVLASSFGAKLEIVQYIYSSLPPGVRRISGWRSIARRLVYGRLKSRMLKLLKVQSGL
ncbi:MAG: DUF5672 family protein [Dechloromonas sp.]|nr:DUF5672 family protein [Dechloromonas sp.]